jgi:hypothetical protein
MFRASFMLAPALLLAGCVTVAPENQNVMTRIDCQLITGNPTLEAEAIRARHVCSARGNAAGLSAGAGITSGFGMSPIAAGFQQAMVQREVAFAHGVACFAEMGFLSETRSQRDQRCAARPASPANHTPIQQRR